MQWTLRLCCGERTGPRTAPGCSPQSCHVPTGNERTQRTTPPSSPASTAAALTVAGPPPSKSTPSQASVVGLLFTFHDKLLQEGRVGFLFSGAMRCDALHFQTRFFFPNYVDFIPTFHPQVSLLRCGADTFKHIAVGVQEQSHSYRRHTNTTKMQTLKTPFRPM